MNNLLEISGNLALVPKLATCFWDVWLTLVFLAYAGVSCLFSYCGWSAKFIDICVQYANVHCFKINGKRSFVIGFIKSGTSACDLPEFLLNGNMLSCQEISIIWVLFGYAGS